MIVSDVTWRYFFKVSPHVSVLENEIREVLYRLNCQNLSYSGGLDSTILLYMLDLYSRPRKIRCFTIAASEDHPDYQYAKEITSKLGVEWKGFIIDRDNLEEKEFDCSGDSIVRQFYGFLEKEGVEDIIACDGIDEYMGGYYDHLHQPNLTTYYHYLSELVPKHLMPLHLNSKKVKVHLPYLDTRLVALYSNYKFSDRFDVDGRKKVMVELARSIDVPEEIINRRKYGFCDAGIIKGD